VEAKTCETESKKLLRCPFVSRKIDPIPVPDPCVEVELTELGALLLLLPPLVADNSWTEEAESFGLLREALL